MARGAYRADDGPLKNNAKNMTWYRNVRRHQRAIRSRECTAREQWHIGNQCGLCAHKWLHRSFRNRDVKAKGKPASRRNEKRRAGCLVLRLADAVRVIWFDRIRPSQSGSTGFVPSSFRPIDAARVGLVRSASSCRSSSIGIVRVDPIRSAFQFSQLTSRLRCRRPGGCDRRCASSRS